MTPEQIAAKRAAAMAMYGGGAPKPAAAAQPASSETVSKVAESPVAELLADLAVDVSSDTPATEKADVWVTDGGEDCRKDAIAYARSTISDAASGEFATALPEVWQRMATVEPTPAMLKAAKKQGTSELAPNGCKIVTFKDVAYLLDPEGKKDG